MVNWNPQVPFDLGPKYGTDSRPISSIQAPSVDESLKYLFSGIGDVIKGSVAAADLYVKESIKDEARTAVDQEREEYKDALTATKTVVSGSPVGVVNKALPRAAQGAVGTGYTEDTEDLSGGSRKDVLLPPAAVEPPSTVAAGIKQVSSLVGASLSGQISDTYYYGRLDAVAKHLRDRYPGYRDYVDQQISALTGVDPANAYIRSIVGDINSYVKAQGGTASVVNKVTTKLMTYTGDPEQPAVFARFRAEGEAGVDRAMQWMNEKDMLKKKVETLELQNKGVNADKSLTKTLTGQMSDITMPSLASSHLAAYTINVGLDQPVNAGDYVQGVLTGKFKITPEATVEAQQRIQSAKLGFERAARKWFDDVKDGRSKTNDIGGPEERDKRIAAYSSEFDTIARNLTAENIPIAATAMQKIKFMGENATLDIFTLPDNVGSAALYKREWEKIDPAAAKELSVKYLTDAKGLGAAKNLVEAHNVRMSTPAPVVDANGKPVTIVSTIDETKKELQKRGFHYLVPKSVDEYIRHIELIAGKGMNDETAKILAARTFGPESTSLLEKFEKDGKSTAGREVIGRYDVWRRLTHPDMVKRMESLGGQTWDNYKSWMEREFGNQLFKREMVDLGQTRYEGRIVWDTEKKALKALPVPTPDPKPPGWTPTAAMEETRDLNRTLSRINSGLSSIANLASYTGQDVEAYLITLLGDLGYKPYSKGGQVAGATGVPAYIMAAINAARAEALEGEETRRKYKAPPPAVITPPRGPARTIRTITQPSFGTRVDDEGLTGDRF